MIVYFKLFNSIKSPHEAEEFARLEIESLLGRKASNVRNFMDEFAEEPLSCFRSGRDKVRPQDAITYELPYGRVQGYRAEVEDPTVIATLAARLGYTREIYAAQEGGSPEEFAKLVLPSGTPGMNVAVYQCGRHLLARIITNQYFLEKADYISKLSRDEQEVKRNSELLLRYPVEELYRIPASSTLSVGKRLQDYFAIREEPSLYLTHYMHPYKGKFHPKMARALLNTVMPDGSGMAMDNFAGSGTLLVEATLMGIKSSGIEVNPLSALMAKVKCECLHLPRERLRHVIERYVADLRDQGTLYARESVALEVSSVDDIRLNGSVKGLAELRPAILNARRLLPVPAGDAYHDFLLLALSGTISDLTRRTSSELVDAFVGRVWDLYRRVCIFAELNSVLRIPVAQSRSIVGDTRRMPEVPSDSVSAIVNSPPYSVALDYIKNDFPQLVLLRLAGSMEQLNRDMMGNPRVNYKRDTVLARMRAGGNEGNPMEVSANAKKAVQLLLDGGREKEAYRCFKFFDDMLSTFREMHRVLRPGGEAAVVIGCNNFMVNGKYHSIPNDEVLLDLAAHVDLHTYYRVDRELQKTSSGNIREETVLFLKKS
jgi:tRNA G10  N-methylase Trm11